MIALYITVWSTFENNISPDLYVGYTDPKRALIKYNTCLKQNTYSHIVYYTIRLC